MHPWKAHSVTAKSGLTPRIAPRAEQHDASQCPGNANAVGRRQEGEIVEADFRHDHGKRVQREPAHLGRAEREAES